VIVILSTKHELNLKDNVFKNKRDFLETLDKKIKYHCIFDKKYKLYTAERYINDGFIKYGVL
jgi:hypothetical protein